MKKYQFFSDEELILRYKKGDNDVGEYVLNKYKPLVRKHANTMYLIGGETEDLIQEGMIGLFKAMRDFDINKNRTFFSFADLCISRQMYSAVEASNRKKHIPLNNYISFSQSDDDSGYRMEDVLESDENSVNPEKILIQKEVISDFYKELRNNLSEFENKVLELYLEGENYVSIAQVLDKSPKSIDNALQRIRQKLAQKK
ncbi:sigma-70 family RNA polymerase sigma factor [Lachnobacterium bovis]|uniref:RNA polymerase sigma factor SigS n=1 Tax=Lachnobacterium bovis DSM 14045 TaxID=1122142 RepID=A0A1H3LPP8_9FIRM|nr:sigma-70 family RNA polymerase sigma factor [Lachnobacterium bovis]SDY66290.1 RNA polymerase sporulation-specific sigma factor [Lachnobacterium bovis DSM 14045]